MMFFSVVKGLWNIQVWLYRVDHITILFILLPHKSTYKQTQKEHTFLSFHVFAELCIDNIFMSIVLHYY